MVQKFVPTVTDYIGNVSGEQAMGILQGLF
jgi:hypothetical protein